MGAKQSGCCKLDLLSLSLPSRVTKRESGAQFGFGDEVETKSTIAVDEEKNKRLSISDFTEMGELGKGGFGRVLLVQHNDSKKLYALKRINKSLLRRISLEFMVRVVLNERRILLTACSDFIVRLHTAFQDEKHLYFLMEYVKGGSVARYLGKQGSFSEETVRFIAAEVLVALQYLHEELNSIYRDLKPENLLVDSEGHVKLADFGLSTGGLTSWGGARKDALRYAGVHRA